MDLDDPSLSRLVLRLRNESHNCWTSSCANDAERDAGRDPELQRTTSLPTSVDPSLVTSKATTLYEGTIASGGNRYEANVVAMCEFKTGQTCGTSITGACSIAYDTSGVDPAMDLTLSGNVQWFGGWGLNFAGGKAQATTGSSAKLKNLILSTGEYSIEAWVAPGNVVQEDMRIVSYSASLTNRNFNLGQTMYDYDFFTRSSVSNANGDPRLSTPDCRRGAASDAAARRRHVRSRDRPPHLRERRARRSPIRRRAARSRTGIRRMPSCSATRCRATACGTASSASSRSTIAR